MKNLELQNKRFQAFGWEPLVERPMPFMDGDFKIPIDTRELSYRQCIEDKIESCKSYQQCLYYASAHSPNSADNGLIFHTLDLLWHHEKSFLENLFDQPLSEILERWESVK